MESKSINVLKLISNAIPSIYVAAGFVFLISFEGFAQNLGKLSTMILMFINFIYILTSIFNPSFVQIASSTIFNSNKLATEKIGGLLLLTNIVTDVVLYPYFGNYFTSDFSIIKLLIYLSLFVLTIPSSLNFISKNNFEKWGGNLYIFIIVFFVMLLNESIGKNTALFNSDLPILPFFAIITTVLLFISPWLFKKFSIFGFALINLVILFSIVFSRYYDEIWGNQISALSAVLLLIISIGFWSEAKKGNQNNFLNAIFGLLILLIFITSYESEITLAVKLYIPLVSTYYDYSIVIITALDVLIAIGAIISANQFEEESNSKEMTTPNTPANTG